MDAGDGGDSWPGNWDDQENELLDDEPDDRRDGRADGGRSVVARLRWVLRTDEGWVAVVREVLSSIAVVAAVGLVLFAVSGLWPPMVAIESPSMVPNLEQGDLVFLMEEHRFAGAAAYSDTGVVPYRTGAAAGYTEFDKYGDVIVYQPNGNGGMTPIIHRARFWVNDSENWYPEANGEFLGEADDCGELANCPAPHGGFITKGDNNDLYDQVNTGRGPISSPVKSSWITGTAEFRIPWLGRIRLLFGTLTADASSLAATTGAVVGGVAGLDPRAG